MQFSRLGDIHFIHLPIRNQCFADEVCVWRQLLPKFLLREICIPKILLLHNQLDLKERTNVLEELSNTQESSSFVLICTDIASRGLDIPNIKHVILYNVPNNISEFVHQAGRTARKGSKGLLTCLIQTQSQELGRYKSLHSLKDASNLF